MRRASAKTLTLICEAIARTTLLEAFLHDEDQVGGGRVGLKTKPAVSNRAYTDKTHLEWVKEFLLDRALTFSSQNESISIVVYAVVYPKIAMQNKRTNQRKTNAPNLDPEPP
ncbi:hypothetical protein [Microcoleus sp. Pol10D4]|uniref:hypothetical protein n=1 Tax=Microcoleus sp. Pol10D4 TaxID=3055387 RepID=UPI002FD200EF